MKNDMKRQRNTVVNRVCDAACLELGEDPVPQQTVNNVLQRIISKPIIYKNSFPPIKQAFVFQRKVRHVEDIIVTRDTTNLGKSRR